MTARVLSAALLALGPAISVNGHGFALLLTIPVADLVLAAGQPDTSHRWRSGELPA